MSTVVQERPDPAAAGGEDALIGVYCYCVQNGALESARTAAADLKMDVREVDTAVSRLAEMGLLQADHGPEGHLVPVDPGMASVLLTSPIEREIFARRDFVDRMRTRLGRLPDAAAARAPISPVGFVDRLLGEAEIRGMLKLAADVCRQEALVLLRAPGAGYGGPMDDFLDGCHALIARGVAVRVVCTHRSRADFANRVRAARLVDEGVAVRTVSHLAQTAVIFDRSLAVLCGAVEENEPAAWRVREDYVVRFLAELLDQMWEGAVPFTQDGSGYAEAADDLHQTIARLMAQGLTDEVVARKLGMSVRTCRRHIGTLMRSLDSGSRFQAGVQAARYLLAEEG